MTEPQASTSRRASGGKTVVGRLFVLDLSDGRVVSLNPDGSDRKVIVTECRHPDGIVVNVEGGHIYWTNMGVPNLNDGSIERADIDGENRKIIVSEGATFTPKQLHLDKRNGKLYWSDREGMRVMRSNLDGSEIETLVETGQGDADRRDATKWCVGITVDPKRGQIYWTQKGPDDAGRGRIFRANIEIPKGQSVANRTDIEVLFDRLPEPIDLELHLENRLLYWTDRRDPPRGNTVNRASVDTEATQDHAPEILLTHLMEGIEDGDRDSVEATLAVVAVGWAADTDGLNLAAAGVEADHRSFVKVDEYMRTSAPHIFAAGDITGRLMLVPPAIQEGFVAATNAVLGPTMLLGDHVHTSASFTEPEYAQTGLTEAKARETHDVVTDIVHFDATTRTIIDGRKAGFCKLIVDRKTAKTLGCHVVGERAVEIAQVAAIAIDAGMRVDDLAQVPLSFPTYTGILANVAAGAARQLNLKVGWQAHQVV